MHEAVRLESKTEFFNTKQNIFICIKGKRDLPIIQISEPIPLNQLEEKATNIAYFLKVIVKSWDFTITFKIKKELLFLETIGV